MTNFEAGLADSKKETGSGKSVMLRGEGGILGGDAS